MKVAHVLRYDSLDIYEITSEELDSIKQGSPNNLLLNLAIATFSITVTLIVTLLTVEVTNDRSFYVLVIILVVSLFSSVIMGVLWYFSEDKFQGTIKKIESRIQENTFDLSTDQEAISIIESNR